MDLPLLLLPPLDALPQPGWRPGAERMQTALQTWLRTLMLRQRMCQHSSSLGDCACPCRVQTWGRTHRLHLSHGLWSSALTLACAAASAQLKRCRQLHRSSGWSWCRGCAQMQWLPSCLQHGRAKLGRQARQSSPAHVHLCMGCRAGLLAELPRTAGCRGRRGWHMY